MTDYVATRSMARFQCLGGACEDTCCKAWEVPISPADIARLQGALGADAQRLVTQVPDGRGGKLTVLQKRADKTCLELEPSGMCSVHARFGESALPDTCATYPRMMRKLDDRLELTGLISCPEVARLTLLVDDDALVPADAVHFGRAHAQSQLRTIGAPPYFAQFDAVRDMLVELSVDDTGGYSLASRLYFVAEWLVRIAPYFHREATVAEPEQVAAALAEVTATRAELHAKRGAASFMNGLALQMVLGLLDTRGESQTPSFEALMTKVASTFSTATTGTPLERMLTGGPQQLWRTHVARRPPEGSPHAARLDRYLARYVRHFWTADWYLMSESLFEHLMHLVMRVALFRLLIVAHPEFSATAEDVTCDRAVVEVIASTSRALTHNAQIRQGLANTFRKQQMLTPEHAAALLKL